MFATRENSKTDTHKPAERAPDKKSAPPPNQVWQALALRPGVVQTKLTVGGADDATEREADRIADRVMRMATPPPDNTHPTPPRPAALKAQRKCSTCEEEEKPAQRKEQSLGTEFQADAPPLVQAALASSGQPLDPGTRTFMEERLGHDLSRVRVHSDGQAAASARAINALAYTVGSDVVFAGGQFSPATASGRWLLAHELVHTIQQGGGHGASARGPVRDGVVRSVSTTAAPAPLIRRKPDCNADKAVDPDTLGPLFVKPKTDVEALGLTKFEVKSGVAGLPYVLFSPHCEAGKVPLHGLVAGGDAYLISSGKIYKQVWAQQAGKPADKMYWGWINPQLLDAGAPVKKKAEAARIGKLQSDYKDAVARADWQRVALLLNAFSDAELEEKLRALSGTDQAEVRYAAPKAMPNFSDRVVKAVDAVNSDAKRISEVIEAYETALAKPDWEAAARALNGFGEGDIAVRVKRLNLHQLAALKAGALSGMKGFSDRVVKPIEARQGTEARAVESAEKSALAHLERLSTKAVGEAGGGADFALAVSEFKKQLKIDLEAVPAGQTLPDDLQIVIKALLLWDVDKGDQWGEGRLDAKDFTPSAGDYAIVPASQNKCNAFLAEVIFRAFGVVHKGHAKEAGKPDARNWFPYRASEWGNKDFKIPNFPVVESPRRGDVLCTGGHVGVYLGKYAGKNIYISARDNKTGVFGIGEQHEHGIQIKYTSDAIYRRYTP